MIQLKSLITTALSAYIADVLYYYSSFSYAQMLKNNLDPLADHNRTDCCLEKNPIPKNYKQGNISSYKQLLTLYKIKLGSESLAKYAMIANTQAVFPVLVDILSKACNLKFGKSNFIFCGGKNIRRTNKISNHEANFTTEYWPNLRQTGNTIIQYEGFFITFSYSVILIKERVFLKNMEFSFSNSNKIILCFNENTMIDDVHAKQIINRAKELMKSEHIKSQYEDINPSKFSNRYCRNIIGITKGSEYYLPPKSINEKLEKLLFDAEIHIKNKWLDSAENNINHFIKESNKNNINNKRLFRKAYMLQGYISGLKNDTKKALESYEKAINYCSQKDYADKLDYVKLLTYIAMIYEQDIKKLSFLQKMNGEFKQLKTKMHKYYNDARKYYKSFGLNVPQLAKMIK